MQNTGKLKCHTITSFPKPFSPDQTLYNKSDFDVSVKNFCFSLSSVLAGLRICKVIVLGDVSVGKTSIVNRFCRQVFNLNYKATIGVDFEVEQFDILNVPFNMQIWDTAGQERFRCIAAAYYRSAHVIITVFDLSSIKSLHHCLLWMNEALTSNLETPLKFLVGTKKDLLSDATYSQVESEAIRLAKLMNSEYWAVSARTGEGVRELFYRIAVLAFEQVIKSELEAPDKKPQIKLGHSLLVQAIISVKCVTVTRKKKIPWNDIFEKVSSVGKDIIDSPSFSSVTKVVPNYKQPPRNHFGAVGEGFQERPTPQPLPHKLQFQADPATHGASSSPQTNFSSDRGVNRTVESQFRLDNKCRGKEESLSAQKFYWEIIQEDCH